MVRSFSTAEAALLGVWQPWQAGERRGHLLSCCRWGAVLGRKGCWGGRDVGEEGAAPQSEPLSGSLGRGAAPAC